jgi:hypothetical protein
VTIVGGHHSDPYPPKGSSPSQRAVGRRPGEGVARIACIHYATNGKLLQQKVGVFARETNIPNEMTCVGEWWSKPADLLRKILLFLQ